MVAVHGDDAPVPRGCRSEAAGQADIEEASASAETAGHWSRAVAGTAVARVADARVGICGCAAEAETLAAQEELDPPVYTHAVGEGDILPGEGDGIHRQCDGECKQEEKQWVGHRDKAGIGCK